MPTGMTNCQLFVASEAPGSQRNPKEAPIATSAKWLLPSTDSEGHFQSYHWSKGMRGAG